MAELGLGDEHAPDRQTVAAADELAARVPDLEGMRVSAPMEIGVEPHDLGRDPSQRMAIVAAASGAGPDHVLERVVEGDTVARLAHVAAQAL